MIFTPAPVPGVWIIDVDRREDVRGFFARTWCREEFEAHGLDPRVVQCNLSRNGRRGTLRGMHWQEAPHGETKLVRCSRGAIWDVVVDLRQDSASYLKHFGVELNARDCRALYIPPGFAHGFVTLEDESDVFYQMSEFYHGPSARGVRWNDPAFGISWPVANPILHERDANYPDYRPVNP